MNKRAYGDVPLAIVSKTVKVSLHVTTVTCHLSCHYRLMGYFMINTLNCYLLSELPRILHQKAHTHTVEYIL